MHPELQKSATTVEPTVEETVDVEISIDLDAPDGEGMTVIVPEEEPVIEKTEYVKTKYTTTVGSIVRVEYEGGVNFILNYNSFDVNVVYNGQTYTVAALGFVRIN